MYFIQPVRRYLLVVIATLLGLSVARAEELVYFLRDTSGPNPRGLYNFNTVTGTSTLRTVVTSTNGLFSFDVQPISSAVFGVDLQSRLFRIHPNTGAVTVVGNTGIAEATLTAIAFRPSDGALFLNAQGTGLYSANPLTASVTLIGATPNVDRGLIFSPTGTLFGFNATTGDLYTVDPATGSTTLVGGSGPAVSVLAEDATFGHSGALYMQDFGGNLFEVNPANGARTLVGTAVATPVVGLFAVPEPTTMVLLGLVGAAGVVVVYRWRVNREKVLEMMVD